jgi:hypothetical protein
MNPQIANLPASKEARLQLAIQAIKCDANLIQRSAPATYNTSRRTLRDRIAGKLFRRDCQLDLMKLLLTEDDVVVQHVLDLDAQGFSPRLTAVKDMADSLLAERRRDPVSQKWAATFAKRRPKLKVKFS